MSNDEETTTLDVANTAAVDLMLAKLTDDDLIAVYEAACGRGPIADLTAEHMHERNLDY